MAKNVRTLANGPHDIGELGARLAETGEIHDLMIRTIECRTDQRVHSGGHAHIAGRAFGLELRDARDQHARCRHEVAPRLHPQFQLREGRLHRGERRIELGEVEARLLRALRHAEPAADVDDPHVRELLGQAREQRRGLFPVGHVEHAAAVVAMEARRPRRPRSSRALPSSGSSVERHAELRRTFRPCARDGDGRDLVPESTRTNTSRPRNTSGHFCST